MELAGPCRWRPASAAFLAHRSAPHAQPPMGPTHPTYAAAPEPSTSNATSTYHATVPTTLPECQQMIPVPLSQPKQIPIGQHFTRLVPLRTRVAAIGQNSGPSLLALAALRPRAIGRRFANTKAGGMQRNITTSKTASFRARTMATRRKAGRIRVPLRRLRRRQFPRRHPPRHHRQSRRHQAREVMATSLRYQARGSSSIGKR